MLQTADNGVNVVVNRTTLDYERQNQYVYTLTAWETGVVPSNSATSKLTINVEDVNEPPLITTSILHAPPGLRGGNPVGTVQVTDPERTRIELTITSGNSDGLFTFPSQYSAQLMVAYGKVIPSSPTRFPMNIEAKDAGGLTYDRVVTVQLCQLPGDTSVPGLPNCPSDVSSNALASGSESSSSSDTATIVVAVVLVLLCVVLVALIVMARRNQNANTQARAQMQRRCARWP
jgi:hypothetical protein